jgi:hypothetical protein
MKILMSIAFVGLCFLNQAYAAAKKVAVVKLLRGEVSVLTMGKTTKLNANEWVEDGAIIKTAEKSFVKLIFIDKSQMNVGPNSEMKIEKFDGRDSGVIDLVKGKIRSQVTKDYLQIQDKDKSKLFIKTPNAVMGIRGTDFMIVTNGKNTSAVLFEGEVVFNRLDARGISNSRRLEDIVDRGVRMFPGEFSVVEAHRNQPTVPSLLNVRQRENLEKNEGFDVERAPGNSKGEATEKSVVPGGLSGEITSNDPVALKSKITQVSGAASEQKLPASSDPNGYIDGEKVKPTNGSFLHVESGIIIAPGADSVLDGNTNTYIPTASSGTVANNGDYIPPKNIMITDNGDIFKLKPGGPRPELTPIPLPSPVKPSYPVATPLPPLDFSPEFRPYSPIEEVLKTTNQVEKVGTTTNATIRARIGN